MIDKTAFAVGMGLLAGSFGREIDGAVSKAYYAVLNDKMTTEEFELAINLVLEEETFWPAPAVLLAKVRDDAAAAGRALRHVDSVVGRCGGHKFVSYDTYHREFDAPTRAAIAACDGLRAISEAPLEDRRWLAKRFVAAHIAASRPRRKELPSLTIDARVEGLVDTVTRAMPDLHRTRTSASGAWRVGGTAPRRRR